MEFGPFFPNPRPPESLTRRKGPSGQPHSPSVSRRIGKKHKLPQYPPSETPNPHTNASIIPQELTAHATGEKSPRSRNSPFSQYLLYTHPVICKTVDFVSTHTSYTSLDNTGQIPFHVSVCFVLWCSPTYSARHRPHPEQKKNMPMEAQKLLPLDMLIAGPGDHNAFDE